MKVRLVHITLRPSGRKSEREETRTVEALRIGRGTDNDLQLTGLTVALHHAVLHDRGGRLFLEGLEGNPVQVDGRLTESGHVAPGDAVRIGGYELRLRAPAAGEDLCLEVEEIERRGAEREELRKRTDVGVDRGLFTRRKLSWALALGIPIALLAVPLRTGHLERFWSSGPISSNHAFIAEDCGKCHQGGFALVRDAECLACHAEIGGHAPSDVHLAGLDEARCASCHLEHGGTSGLAALEQSFCTDCHGDLAARLPGTSVEDARDFLEDHPQFRIALVTDPASGATERVRWTPQLRERSGLVFNHWRHVAEVVADKATGGKRNMQCGDCHVPDPAGKTMMPVVFEKHCRSCHSLTFDERMPERQVAHGDPVEIRRELGEFYAWAALSGATNGDVPGLALRRRRPGVVLTETERVAALTWAGEKATQADHFFLRDPGTCAECHEVRPGAAADGGDGVAPALPAHIWMPKAAFSHASHEPFACRECHPAAAVYDPEKGQKPRPAWSLEGAPGPYALYTPAELRAHWGVEPSRKADDILVPGIETCRRCHGGGQATPPLVASDCVLCHAFHRREHGAMREPAHASWDAPPWRGVGLPTGGAAR